MVLVSSLTVLALTSFRAARVEQELSAQLIARGTGQVARALDAFLDPARKYTRLATSWGASGTLTMAAVVDGVVGTVSTAQLSAAQRLVDLLLPVLRGYQELSSVQLGNAEGAGFLVLEEADGARVRVVNRELWGLSTLWFRVNADGALGNPEWREIDYDPRRRAWFTGLDGLADGVVSWTDPYLFFTTGELGITASGAWRAEGVRHAIAWDVLLKDVTRFTRSLAADLSANSSIVVMTEDHRLIGLPRQSGTGDAAGQESGFLTPADSFPATEVQTLGARVRDLELPASTRFEAGARTWWAGVEEYRVGPDLPIRIAVLVPSVDLLQDLRRQRLLILAATVLALAAALGYSLFMARSYSRPLEMLARQSRRIGDLDFSADQPVSADLAELRELAGAQQRSLTALRSFSRYVPNEVVSELVKTNSVAKLGGDTREVTVLFTDIASFTSIAEGMSPDALAAHLALYFERVIDVLHAHGATVDKLIGDSVMAFWGAPRRDPGHRRAAVEAVLEVRKVLRDFDLECRRLQRPVLHTRFGLAAGSVMAGNFGAPSRLAYTIFGDTVNLASRLEGLNKLYGTQVIAEERVAAAGVGDWRRLDRVRVLGRSSPVWIYELPDADAGWVAAEAYQAAWDRYAAADFVGALALLGEIDPGNVDPAAARLRRVCEALAEHPPGRGWEAVTDVDRK